MRNEQDNVSNYESRKNIGIYFAPREGNFLKPIREMSWEEEFSELTGLVDGVADGYHTQNPATQKAFDDMFLSWEHRMRRFSDIGKYPDFLKKTMIDMMGYTIEFYSTDEVRDAYNKFNMESAPQVVYFAGYHNEYNIYTPRSLRMGIMYYGLDGKERVRPKDLREKEGLFSHQNNLQDFCYRFLRRAEGSFKRTSENLFK